MKLCDKNGWPIVPRKRRPIHNLLRRLFDTDIMVTWRLRAEGNPTCPDCGMYIMSAEEVHSCKKKPKKKDLEKVPGITLPEENK